MNFEFKADFKPTLQWLENIKKGTDDARPLWFAMLPRVHAFVAEEFSGTNPNKWAQYKPNKVIMRTGNKSAMGVSTYKAWKVNHGYPWWIGVMTGRMKRAANENATINVTPKKLTWELNKSGTPTKGGDQYAQFFSGGTRKMTARPIYKSTVLRVNNLLRQDINNMKGQSRSSFTFAWIEKALEDYRKS